MKAFGETVYLDAVLTPNRSLSKQGFRVVLVALALSGALTGLIFWQMGAGPVLAFLGADIFFVGLAIWLSRRSQREETRITITARTIHLCHTDPKGRRRQAELPSAFTRVEIEEPAGPQSWLRLAHGQRAFIIGRFLTPPERLSLAGALRQALHAARAERPAG